MNYFITAVVRVERYLRPDKIDTRTFGYYPTLQEAIEAVEQNRCNMHECLYNYLVIEEIGPGIHPCIQNDRWYKWINGKWVGLCSKPDYFYGVINWAIG